MMSRRAMRRHRVLHLSCFVGALALIASSIAAIDTAGEAAPVVDPGFIEAVDVHVVNVEAVVTDPDGQRIKGLGPDDFRLLVDGEEMPIGYFTEIRDRRAVAVDRDRPQRVPSAVRPERPVPVRYLVFFDEIFTGPRARRLMSREIEHHIDALVDGDTMSLVAFDGIDPTILVEDSADPAVLRNGLEVLADARRFRGDLRRAERRFFRDAVAEFTEARFGDIPDVIQPTSYAASRMVDRDAETVLEALAVSMRRMAQTSEPGRKVLLWVTGSWPIQPSFRAMPVLGPDRPGERPEAEHGRKPMLERFARLASRLGFTIYSIDAVGWQMNGGGTDAGAADREGIGGRPNIAAFWEQEAHATLEAVAEITGGEAYLNSFRRDALGRVQDDVGHYYWLGFDAPWPSDGREVQIELVPRRADLSVRARTGTWAAPRDRLRQLDLLAGQFAEPNATFDGLRIELGEVELLEDDLYQRHVELVFEVAELTALPVEEGHQIQLEARVAAFDRRGRHAKPAVHSIVLTDDQPPTADGVARYAFDAVFSERAERLLVTLHDQLGTSIFLATTPLEAPER